MSFFRVSVNCRHCKGNGFHEMHVDDEGQGHLDECRLCYRGKITLKLTGADLLDLEKQIAALIAP